VWNARAGVEKPLSRAIDEVAAAWESVPTTTAKSGGAKHRAAHAPGAHAVRRGVGHGSGARDFGLGLGGGGGLR
jgi:hypothetical protein